MIVRTCLLISDDPDDHVEFSEALYAISNDTVLVTVSDVNKAISLLKMKKCVPEFLFIHLGIPAFEPDVFFQSLLGDDHLKTMNVIGFGDPASIVSSNGFMAVLNGDMNYAELKEALRRLL